MGAHWLQSGRREDNGDSGTGTSVVIKARPKTRKPAMYKVLMLNDDYTPMEFVVHVLERLLPEVARRGDPHHDARPPPRSRRVRRVHL